jgi:hypothetical protein
MISRGVPAGASRPYQIDIRNPLTPASSAVGTSGSVATRLGESTASGRTLPCLISGSMEAIETITSSTSPLIAATVASVAPL